jgi:hypothetical protein
VLLEDKVAVIYGGEGTIGSAVDRHADEVASSAAGIDISLNEISHDYVQGTPLVEMALDGRSTTTRARSPPGRGRCS